MQPSALWYTCSSIGISFSLVIFRLGPPSCEVMFQLQNSLFSEVASLAYMYELYYNEYELGFFVLGFQLTRYYSCQSIDSEDKKLVLSVGMTRLKIDILNN